MPDYHSRQINMSFGPQGISPVVRSLLIANVVVFIIQSASHILQPLSFFDPLFMMTPKNVFHGYVWQLFTYMFLHKNFVHIFFNMLFLWMFGVDVERHIGSRSFGLMYLSCGLTASVLTCLVTIPAHIAGVEQGVSFLNNTAFGHWFYYSPFLGASGAIFGIMAAFGLLFPDRIILVFFILPVRAIYVVVFSVLFEVLYMVSSMPGSNVAHIMHVTGALTAFILIRFAGKMPSPREKIREFKQHIDDTNEAEDQRRVDEILDKINREGMHKLSRSDREFLKRRSMRRKG